MFFAEVSEQQLLLIQILSWVVVASCGMLTIFLPLMFIASLLRGARDEECHREGDKWMLTNGVAVALPAMESSISLHYDPSTGKQYSYNGRTGKTEG